MTPKLCTNCKYFINHHIPIVTKYGYCRLTRTIIQDIVDPMSGQVVLSYNKYNYASHERGLGGSCRPEGLLYQHEPDVFQRLVNQQTGTFYALMMLTTYIILLFLVCMIVTELVYFV